MNTNKENNLTLKENETYTFNINKENHLFINDFKVERSREYSPSLVNFTKCSSGYRLKIYVDTTFYIKVERKNAKLTYLAKNLEKPTTRKVS